jgi:hypothetical protein
LNEAFIGNNSSSEPATDFKQADLKYSPTQLLSFVKKYLICSKPIAKRATFDKDTITFDHNLLVGVYFILKLNAYLILN